MLSTTTLNVGQVYKVDHQQIWERSWWRLLLEEPKSRENYHRLKKKLRLQERQADD